MYKIGQSQDIHRLEKGQNLIIGGIKIIHDKGTVAHSDGDVLLHAIIESIIGALGLGDIGDHFPDTNNKFKNISSAVMLEEVLKLMIKEGYTIVNLDTLIICDTPKLSKYKRNIKDNICKLLKTNDVNIKATTNEKLGELGNNLAIMAQAIIMLKKEV